MGGARFFYSSSRQVYTLWMLDEKYPIHARCREKVACGHKTRLICARYHYCGHIYTVKHAQLSVIVACGHKYMVKCAQGPGMIPAIHRGQRPSREYFLRGDSAHGRTNLLHRGHSHYAQMLQWHMFAHGELHEEGAAFCRKSYKCLVFLLLCQVD